MICLVCLAANGLASPLHKDPQTHIEDGARDRARHAMDGDSTRARLRLRADRSLLHEEGACLPLRSRHGQCQACADACPVSALAIDIDAVSLSDACIGCGRCTAACPTQALSLPEVTRLPLPTAGSAAPVRIECRKVPASAHVGQTQVVPCLGAVSVGMLLQRAAAGHDVDLVDRGWCTGCEAHAAASRPGTPAAAALETATLWLEAVQSERQLRSVLEPLSLQQRPAAIPALPEEAPPLDRRHFFRAALERPAGRQRGDAVPMGGDGRAAYPAAARTASPERQSQHAALIALAGAAGTAVPAEFFPQLHVDASCCDRRMCEALCPTAALSIADDGATSHLQWSSERCIACGTCVRACPEHSLTLAAHGGAAGTRTLISHHRARCVDCGDAYTQAAGTDSEPTPQLCPTCTKARRFMDDARRQLFGTANRPPEETKETPWA